MPDTRVVEELEGNLRALQERRDELMQDLPAIEEVTQSNAAVTELRAMLEATGGDAGEAKEKLEEYVEKLGNLGGEIRKAIEDPAVAQLTEGVGAGLEQFSDALEAVNETLEPLEQALDVLQSALETSEAPADQQIEALAETFATVVDKLEPLIDRIPGLGAFFAIYAKAIQAIAQSVGQIQATQRSLQRAWGRLFPGTTMYIHPRNAHEIRQGQLRAIDMEIERTVTRLTDIAREQRTAIPDDQMTDVDIAVRVAERDCRELLPSANPPELQARNNAWRELQQADDARSDAQGDYDAACEDADRAAIRLETATAEGARSGSVDVDASRANAASTAAARGRALERLRAREADHDAARSTYDGAQADWRALNQPYEDCMKSRLQQIGRDANAGRGFSENDQRYLGTMYPEYAGPPATTPAPTTPAPSGPPPSTPREVSAATGGGGFPRRLVLGGGGILAIAMAGIAIVLSGGGGDDAPAGATEASGSANALATSAASGEPAAATTVDASVCEVAHARQDIVQLSSPDVQPAIPASYTRDTTEENGFPTPRFEWGEMPEETTEIAILVQRLTRDRGAEYQQDDRLWWNLRPIGLTVWLVTGIDATARSLPVTSLTTPPPGNAVERQHENGRYTVDGEVYEQQFWINTGEPHLFTVFALCDPPLAGTSDDYNQLWLLQNAVAIGWFYSSLE